MWVCLAIARFVPPPHDPNDPHGADHKEVDDRMKFGISWDLDCARNVLNQGTLSGKRKRQNRVGAAQVRSWQSAGET